MGYAIAEACSQQGAIVTLISGPCAQTAPSTCQFIAVTCAKQMQEAVNQHIQQTDMLIATAAVCDYRPSQYHQEKIKKSPDHTCLNLSPNSDILKQSITMNTQCTWVGFAVETNQLLEHAQAKKKAKQLDFIVANCAKESLGHDEIQAHIIDPDQHIHSYETMSKTAFAIQLVQRLSAYQRSKQSSCVS